MTLRVELVIYCRSCHAIGYLTDDHQCRTCGSFRIEVLGHILTPGHVVTNVRTWLLWQADQ
jgi:hypothetical protein